MTLVSPYDRRPSLLVRLKARAAAWFASLFADRQILVRSEGRVRYVLVSRKAQIALLSVIGMASAWVGYTNAMYFSHQAQVESRDAEIDRTKRAYRALLAELSDAQGKFTEIARDLEANHLYLLGLVEQNSSLRQSLEVTREQLQSAESERSNMTRLREQLREKLKRLEHNLDSMMSRNSDLQSNLDAMSRRLEASEHRIATLTQERERMIGELGRMEAAFKRYDGIAGRLAASEREVTDLVGERERLQKVLAEMEKALAGYETVKSRLRASEREVADLTGERARLRLALAEMEKALNSYDTVKGQIRASEREVAHLARERERLVADLGQLESVLGGYQEIDGKLKQTESQVSRLTHERDQLKQRIARLEASLPGTAATAGATRPRVALAAAPDAGAAPAQGDGTAVAEGLDLVEDKISRIIDQQAQVLSDRERLRRRVTELETRLATLHHAQKDVVRRLTERTDDHIQEVERLIAMTGIDVDRMIETNTESLPGRGGPFVAWRPGLDDGSLGSLFGELDDRLERWEKLKQILAILPLTFPVDQYNLASGFGKRRDPFNSRWAMHDGVDLSAPYKTPIHTTAPGRVAFAGWRTRYGRVVEVDHGMGLRTLYAHLAKITVKKGQEVAYRDRIGFMGSSGRSTGSHVHYEVLVNGKALDPYRFMEAGRYVFKEER